MPAEYFVGGQHVTREQFDAPHVCETCGMANCQLPPSMGHNLNRQSKYIIDRDPQARRNKCADGEHDADHMSGGIELQHVNGFPGREAVVCKHCRNVYVPK